MAQGVGATHPITGVQQTFGGMFWSPLDISGSASYVQGGDTLSPPSFGFNSYIWSLTGGVSQSGTYFVLGRALSSGYSQFQLVWFVTATGAEVGAGTPLDGETVRIAAIGQ